MEHTFFYSQQYASPNLELIISKVFNKSIKMKSKFWKVAWLIWSLLTLSVCEIHAWTSSGTSGGTNWLFDSGTGCLTISANQKSSTPGVMANYHGEWNYPCGDSTLYGAKGSETLKGNSCPGNYKGSAPWYTATKYGWYVRSNVTCLVVEEGVKTLGAASFYGLQYLKSVQLPESLEEIGYEAFRYCYSLDSIHIGPNVCTIRDRWATGCTSLATIEIDKNNPCYHVDAYGAVYDITDTILIKVPQALNINELTIPEGVTQFATDALYQSKTLQSLVLPSTLKEVDYGALDAMPNLKYIYFNSVEAPVFQKKVGAGTDASHLVIYIPCTPSDNYDERKDAYALEVGVVADNIEKFLSDYKVEAISENPRKGTAGVTTRMTCDDSKTTITATPNPGYNFLYWESDKSSTRITQNPYVFECTQSVAFTAYFSSNSYAIEVTTNIGENGTTTGSDTYEVDTEVTISASATKDCYTFERWDDEGEGNDEPTRTITVGSSSKTYTAIFSKGELEATASSNNSDWGTASILKNGEVLTGSAYCGDSLTFVAEAKDHAHFIKWSSDETETSIDTVIYDNVTMKAIFALDSFLITFKDYDSTILQSKPYAYGSAPSCDQPTREATAEYTYTFNSWSPAIASVSGEATYVAQYDSTANPYKFITVVGTKQTPEVKTFGTAIEEPATPEEKTGYTFQYWMDEDSVQVNFPFSMPAKDTVVYAYYKVNSYTLKVYDMDKETLLADTAYNYNSTVVMPTAPAHEGYKFSKWSETISTMPAENKTIYALYDTLKFNVTYTDRNNVAITKANVKYNSVVEAIEDPKEEGYTFLYWKNEAGDQVEFPFNMPAKDTTILSEWKINQHNVVYVKDNGEENDTLSYDYNKTVAAPKNPVKEGYTFVQWNNGNGEKQNFSFSMPDADVVLTAQYDINSYTFKVIVDKDTTTTDYEYNATVTMPSSPVKEGYTFTGWSDSISVMPAKDVTTIAQWKINNYQLTYYNADTVIYGPLTVDYNEMIVAQKNPKKEGHTFKGWEVMNQQYTEVPSHMPANDLDIVSTWVVDTFNYNVNIDGEVVTKRRIYGETFNMPQSPIKDCYTFTGWSDSTTTMPAHDVTTTAQWKVNAYQLTFLQDDEETIISSKATNCGASIEAPVAKKDGYKFVAWTNENGAEVTVPATMPENDLTFIASYERDSFVITFLNMNGDTVKSDKLEYEAAITLPADPTYQDYVFVKWSPEVPATVPAHNMTFTAVYDMDMYTVTFYDIDEVTEITSYEANSAAKIQEYTNYPVHEGTEFSHWTDKKGREVEFPFTLAGEDTTFYAVYDSIMYHVYFYPDTTKGFNPIHTGELYFENSLSEEKAAAEEKINREGYTFDKWVLLNDVTEEAPSTMPSHDLYLAATWTPNEYKVIFAMNNGQKNDTLTYKYGEQINAPGNPEKECHTFQGWGLVLEFFEIGNNLGNQNRGKKDTLMVNFPVTMKAYDVTYDAIYSQNMHNLIFKTNASDEDTLASIEIGCGDEVDFDLYTSDFSMDSTGYKFVGWSDSITVMPEHDVFVNAVYEKDSFGISFICIEENEMNQMNEIMAMPEPVYYLFDDLINIPEADEREGYTFMGWINPRTREYLKPGDRMPAENIYFECNYDINSYKVVFLDYNEDTLKYYNSVMYTDTFSAPADPVREGYSFTGWDNEIPEKMPAHDLVFTAQYEKEIYSVVFYTDETETKTVKSILEEYGTPVVAPTPSTSELLVREGFTFDGWDEEVPATIPADGAKLHAQWTRNSHELTIMYDQDSLIRKTTKAYDDTITAPADPERKGYSFIGWKEEIPSNMPDHDVYSVAQFSINQYEVRFYDYDSVFIKGSKGDYGSPVTAPVPSRKGYTFSGWNKEVPETIEKNDTLYAVYEVNSYDVLFLDWDSRVILPYTDTFGAKVKTPEDPVRAGYKFTKWTPDVPETIGASHLTFIAQYEKMSYDVTYFDYDSTTVIKKYTVEYEDEIPTAKNPTRDGYTFAGWDPEVPATMPDSNVATYATYEVKKYIITYQNDNGKVLERDTFEFGAPVTVTDLVPEKEGHTFTGWSAELPETMPNENITVKATYETLKYVISFRYEDTKKNIKTSTLLYGANIVAPEIPEREGYEIIGWDRTIPSTVPAHNDTFYAQYKINQYLVEFKDKESNTTYFSEKLDYGTEVPAFDTPTKKGYTFVEWDAEVTTVPAYNITVFAIWSANPYMITYRDWDKTTIEIDTIDCGATIEAIADPEREGYTFIGWTPALPEVMPAKDLKVTAQYDKKKYEIIFRDEDGEIIVKDSLDYGDPIVAPEDPKKEGYDFEGWEPELPETVPAEDIDVKPIFTRASYVIVFEDYDGTEIDKDTLAFEAKVKKPSNPTRVGHTFTGWEPTAPTKMPGHDVTCVAQYEKNSYVVVVVDDEDNEIIRDTLEYGDPIVAPEDPEKEGYTFDGWKPAIPEFMPDSDIYTRPTWTEDTLIIEDGSVKAISDKFCAGGEAGVEFTLVSGLARTFEVTFSKEAIAAGFKKSIKGSVDEDGNVYFEIPSTVEEGTYKATLQLFGETKKSVKVDFKFSLNPNSRYLSRMWDDVVVCDNSELEFVEYQWYKDGEMIDGANNQFYCDLGGLEGTYSVEVTTVKGEKKMICGTTFERILPPFSIVAYPNPAKANENFTLEVKGLSEEELETAKIYVYKVSGTIAHTERKIDYKNLVSLPQGEYVALVVLEGKSAFCKVIVR